MQTLGVVALAALGAYVIGVLGGILVTHSLWWVPGPVDRQHPSGIVLGFAQAVIGLLICEWICRRCQRPGLEIAVCWTFGLFIVTNCAAGLVMIDMIDTPGRWTLASDAAYSTPWMWTALSRRFA